MNFATFAQQFAHDFCQDWQRDSMHERFEDERLSLSINEGWDG
jgi:hypothetical protein